MFSMNEDESGKVVLRRSELPKNVRRGMLIRYNCPLMQIGEEPSSSVAVLTRYAADTVRTLGEEYWPFGIQPNFDP